MDRNRDRQARRPTSEKSTVVRSAETGRFVVQAEGKDRRGGERWMIAGKRGGDSRVVVADSKSAATMDRIATRRSKALKRLADK